MGHSATDVASRIERSIESVGQPIGVTIHQCIVLDHGWLAIIHSHEQTDQVLGLLTDLSERSHLFAPNPHELVAAAIRTELSSPVEELAEDAFVWTSRLAQTDRAVRWRTTPAFRRAVDAHPEWQIR